jgi:adenylate kinase
MTKKRFVTLYFYSLHPNLIMIVAISGTPGTGKSVIGKILADKLGWDYIDLNALAREKDLFSDYDEERHCDVVDINALYLEIQDRKGDLVIESHFAHEMPADVVIILRTQPKELIRRLREKKWPQAKIDENVQAEIMEVCKTEALENAKKIEEFDTTKKKPEEVAEKIIEYLNRSDLNPHGF